ncbi:MAG TPA: DUF167 domain-containing protein [Prosthecobacter sp.]
MMNSNDSETALTQLVVRVTPNARKTEFSGWGMDEKGRSVMLMKLGAPPVDGKANVELIQFLAKALGCAKSQITLLRGESSRQKVLELPQSAYAKLPPLK